jgi:hypothetical protein
VAEVEITRNQQGIAHKSIIKNFSGSIIAIVCQGFSKIDETVDDGSLEDMGENTCGVSSGYTLETIARAIGDDVLSDVLSFIFPKFTS